MVKLKIYMNVMNKTKPARLSRLTSFKADLYELVQKHIFVPVLLEKRFRNVTEPLHGFNDKCLGIYILLINCVL